MKFNVNQQDLQQALNYCQGVIEKRSTLPILSNILLDASNSKLTITATDLDLIFIHQLNNVEVSEEGNNLLIFFFLPFFLSFFSFFLLISCSILQKNSDFCKKSAILCKIRIFQRKDLFFAIFRNFAKQSLCKV